MRKLFFVIACVGLAISCKEDKKVAEPQEAVQEVEENENFIVEIDAKAAKADDFTLYYTEDGTSSFTGEQAVWKGIQGGNVEDKVILELEEDVVPTNIRLDFGLNKEQDSVVVSAVKIVYFDNEFEIKGSQFFDYFIENNEFDTEINAANSTLTMRKKGNEYKTPFFYPRQELVDKLKQITAGSN